MSYDINVFLPEVLGPGALIGLIHQRADLAVDDYEGESTVIVLRGARKRYSFTVEGPQRLEPEDVPSDVTAKVLGVRYLYSVMVEGSSPTEVPHAIRIARLIATNNRGAAVDQQTGRVWSRHGLRKPRVPPRDARVSCLDLDWYCLDADVPSDASNIFVTAARDLLPEALPRRFGEFEPLQGRTDPGQYDSFHRAWASATSTLHFAGQAPCVGGHMAPVAHKAPSDNYWSMSISFLSTGLVDSGWYDAIRGLFRTLAENLGCFFAQATLSRGWGWSGRSLWADAETESSLRTLRYRDGWLGLPPIAVLWAWFGDPYRFVFDFLPHDGREQLSTGVAFWGADTPAQFDDVHALTHWLPSELFAQLAENPRSMRPQPLVRAPKIPPSLS